MKTSHVRVWETGRRMSSDQQPDIEQIEHKRQKNPDVDAVYLLSPQPHIVDCIMADFERRRYRRSNLVWTSCEFGTAIQNEINH